MKKRIIRKVAVLGSGVMGSRLACHFVNAGIQVLLLDLPGKPSEKDKKEGRTEDHPAVRNSVADQHLRNALKSNPSPIFSPSYASRIQTGNFEDDLEKIKECDWVIEAIVENLEIKTELFEKVDKLRSEGTLVSSNTSGIPIQLMSKGRSADFREHFCGTHFFNPPRYLELLEIIPGPDASEEVVDFLLDFGDRLLGKTTVKAKDTPAFIGNRIGVFGIMWIFRNFRELGLSMADIDKLTGPLIGRPKSATFRTADVVGLDTLVHVADNLYEACEEDEQHEIFKVPDFIRKMVEKDRLGAKSGQGFYKKVKNDKGESEILSLDFESMEYKPSEKSRFPVLEQTKSIDREEDRFPLLVASDDKAGEFFRKSFAALFSYCSMRIPEIADDLYQIDDAMRAGFGWAHGPFQIWDAIGVEKGLSLMEKEGYKAASWVRKMLKSGRKSFYAEEKGKITYYRADDGKAGELPAAEKYILLDHIRGNKTLWSNEESSIIDLGDGILNFEIHSKMNSLGGGVLSGLNKAIDMAEEKYEGLVIANEGKNFSVGANIGMIFMFAAEQEYDELNFAVKHFQNSMMRVRYSVIPVVVAPHQMALGGGCEMTLHADAVQAAAETYIGLVEFGVGVIPGGGGTKEMTLRAAKRYVKGDIELNAYREYFLNIGMAKVAKSAVEAYEMGIFRPGHDRISMNKNRRIAEAKERALQLAAEGYTQPIEEKVKVLGRQALGMFYAGIHGMWEGKYISEHDKKVSEKLAWVMAGGDLSEPAEVPERYLLDLEREAFLSLCGERKTLERLQHMIKTGKPLRN